MDERPSTSFQWNREMFGIPAFKEINEELTGCCNCGYALGISRVTVRGEHEMKNGSIGYCPVYVGDSKGIDLLFTGDFCCCVL